MIIRRGPKSGSKSTTSMRQRLRRESTAAEQLFWSKVGHKQFYNLKFRRQHGIGNYIVDFYCPEKKLVIEIDGDTHAGDEASLKDDQRTNYIESLGYSLPPLTRGGTLTP